jgi:hypothetical protein
MQSLLILDPEQIHEITREYRWPPASRILLFDAQLVSQLRTTLLDQSIPVDAIDIFRLSAPTQEPHECHVCDLKAMPSHAFSCLLKAMPSRKERYFADSRTKGIGQGVL